MEQVFGNGVFPFLFGIGSEFGQRRKRVGGGEREHECALCLIRRHVQ